MPEEKVGQNEAPPPHASLRHPETAQRPHVLAGAGLARDDGLARKGPPHPAANIDFQALELEIDREIDSLFVPSIEKTGGARWRKEADDSARSDADMSQSGAVLSAGVNLQDLQVEINKEIDNLIVPAPRSDWDGGAPRTGCRPQPDSIESMPPAFDDIQKYQMHELSGLIELFNAAYLSLDWEFSRQNIEKFIASLDRLEPFASRSSEAKAVLRILDVILKRLRDRPHAVNSRLVQLIRDSQGLLAHMLLTEGNSGPHEKQRLKDLVERFQELRQRALAIKGEAKGPSLSSDTGARVLALKPKDAETVAEIPPTCEKTDSAQPSSHVRRENLCLIVSCGKCLALPASCILKVARSSARKRIKILIRGYATLADFTSLLRGVSSGVMGQWAELPAKDLKSLRFEPLDLHECDHAAADAPVAVLAGDGQTHRIVFCEIASFVADVEISTAPPTGETFGPFENKWRLLVPVFDPQSAGSSAQSSIVRPQAGRAETRPSTSSLAAGQ